MKVSTSKNGFKFYWLEDKDVYGAFVGFVGICAALAVADSFFKQPKGNAMPKGKEKRNDYMDW